MAATIAGLSVRSEKEALVIHNIQPLTTMAGAEISPAFSPDSRRVAFVAFQDNGGISDIFVQQLGTTTPVQLTNGEGAELLPTWSPDGQFIVYLSYEIHECALYKKPSFGGTALKLRTISCQLGGISWSVDGSTLVLSIYDEEQINYRLYTLNLATMELVSITTPAPSIMGDVTPRFSPEGGTIAFLRNVDNSTKDIYILNWSNPDAEPVRLTRDGVRITGFDWAADGKSIVFASDRRTAQGLWRISVEKDEPPALIRAVSVHDPGSVVLARSGKQLIYTDWTYEVNIWGVPVRSFDSAAFEPVLVSTRADFHPNVSSNNQLTFISTRTGLHEVWISNLDASEPVRLTEMQSGATLHPVWSPDGSQIAFESRTDGQSDIYTIEASGGVPKRITNEAYQEARPTWSQDGMFIYFGSDRSGDWQIYKRSLSDGSTTRVTQGGGVAGWESADGTAFFYTRQDTSGVWIKSFEDGSERFFVEADPSFVTLTERSLFYIAPPNNTNELTIMRRDLASGESEPVAVLPIKPLHYFSRWGFTVSSDEKWIYFGQVDKSESDLMLTEGKI